MSSFESSASTIKRAESVRKSCLQPIKRYGVFGQTDLTSPTHYNNNNNINDNNNNNNNNNNIIKLCLTTHQCCNYSFYTLKDYLMGPKNVIHHHANKRM